jgi:hypothetical protein
MHGAKRMPGVLAQTAPVGLGDRSRQVRMIAAPGRLSAKAGPMPPDGAPGTARPAVRRAWPRDCPWRRARDPQPAGRH